MTTCVLLNVEKVTCCFCGRSPKKYSLELHHIDGDHENNDLNNLIYLCVDCHRIYHHDGGHISAIQRGSVYPQREHPHKHGTTPLKLKRWDNR